MSVLENHLQRKDEHSPFAVHWNSMIDAIGREIEANLDKLQVEVGKSIDDTWLWLEPMFKKESDDSKDEETVAENVQKYVIKARREMESANSLIARLEQAYGAENLQ